MARYLIGLLTHLPDAGFRVSVFHRYSEPIQPQHLKGLNCDVVPLRDHSVVHWEQVVIPHALRQNNIRLYHAPAERGVPLRAPCPVAFTLHSATQASFEDLVNRGLLPGPVDRYLGYAPQRKLFNWRQLLARLQMRRVDHFFTPSHFAKEEIVRLLGVQPARISVTPLAAPDSFQIVRDDVRAARVMNKLGIRKPFLLFVGGFEPHKNPVSVLATYAKVQRSFPKLSLVLVGTGEPPVGLIEAADSLSLKRGEDYVIASNLGEELIDLYDSASAFISLSWRESFGVPYLEALSRGVPVVASSWGAAPEVLQNAAKLVDPRSIDEAANAVSEVLQITDKAQFSTAALLQSQKFNWQRTVELTVDAYLRILHK